jgi:hypothetical protein
MDHQTQTAGAPSSMYRLVGFSGPVTVRQLKDAGTLTF